MNSTELTTALGVVEYSIDGTGPVVLVLHGTPGGIDHARAMARFLPRDRVRPLLLSRPGYLGTELGSNKTIDQQAALIVAVLDALSIETASVLSWSGGGPVGYRLAVLYPDRIRSIVALAGVSKAIPAPTNHLGERFLFGTPVGSWLLRTLASRAPKQVITGVLSGEGALTSAQLDEQVRDVLADDDKRRFVLDIGCAAQRYGSRKAGFANDYFQFTTIDTLDLEKITVPCLLVHGSVDIDVPPDHSEQAAARIPDAELAVVAEGTHLAFYTQPGAAELQKRAIDLLA